MLPTKSATTAVATSSPARSARWPTRCGAATGTARQSLASRTTRQDPARRSTLVTTRDETGPMTAYRFDVHLQGERETVFLSYPRHQA